MRSIERIGGPDSATLHPAEARDSGRQNTYHYEYRDVQGRVIKAKLEVETSPSAPEKAKFKTFLQSQGIEGLWLNEYVAAFFPNDEIHVMRSFVLAKEDGAELDVLADCNLTGKTVFVGKGVHGGVFSGYDGFFTSEPKTVLQVYTLLHENGHVEQLQDSEFIAQQETLSRDTPRRGESSPHEAGMEYDANRRLVERVMR